MRNDDSITKADLQSLRDFIRQENRKLDNSINRVDEKIESVKKDVAVLKKDMTDVKKDVANLDSKVDTLTDAVIEGFDNTEKGLTTQNRYSPTGKENR